MSKEIEERIKKLTEELNRYNHVYYQESRSEISDFEFDQKLKELKELEDQYPNYIQVDSSTGRVGGTITEHFETVYHQYPMLSLGNTYSTGDLVEFDKRVEKGLGGKEYEYVCELKFDGVAISLIYQNGFLKQAVTRGDGEKGDDVTANVKTIRSVPLSVKGKAPKTFEARGEVFMPKKVFQSLNEERSRTGEALLANPRNTASGTLKMKDSSMVAKRRLDCFLYSLLGENLEIATHEEALGFLKKLNFNVPSTYQKCSGIEEVLGYIKYWETKRLELPVETDGIVVKVDRIGHQEELGHTAKSPRWAISYKYKAEVAETELLDIVYQVGRTGAITPVAKLAPVPLGGTVVKRASLHNANEIGRLDVRAGDCVYVEKGGEIIPKITGVNRDKRPKNTKPTAYASACPECGSALVKMEGEANHYCPNTNSCPPQIMGRVEHFVSKNALDIEFLGPRTIHALFKEKMIGGSPIYMT